ncbi:MAG TPA: Fic family protein [Acidimicrobiales bacterium]|nr:Fic family protein [Acidimicrobiales bacterium]
MLFTTPELTEPELRVIMEIDDVAEKLRLRLHEPHRWSGSLRRAQFARAVQGSNSIEGYDAPLDDAAAIELGEEPLDADEETRRAIRGYCDAMTYVLQMSTEPDFHYGEQLLKSLHFMMTSYDLKNRPGLWRAGAIFVRDEESGDIVYEGAEIDDVPALMHELVLSLNVVSDCPPMVHAGMAHLNLVMIHPFRDGNGRMARCLQTLILARQGILSPVFCSIEEYLGRNTPEYYKVLAQVGGGSWQPDRDARPWMRFILTAHLRQARTTLRRIKESERLWGELESLVSLRGLPSRTLPILYDAAMRFRVRNATYRAILEEGEGEEITEQAAGRDLKQLTDAGLLIAHGEKRGRFYTASKELMAARAAIVAGRDPRDDSDPFAVAA